MERLRAAREPFVHRDRRARGQADERAARRLRARARPTGRSRASSAASARRRPCACTPRARWRPARPCCCGCVPGRRRPTERRRRTTASIVAHNPCLSGGALEIFLDPQLAAPRDRRRRATRRSRARSSDGRARGRLRRRARRAGDVEPRASDAALVVASHGERRGGGARARRSRPASATSRSWPAAGAAPRCSTSLDVPDALRDAGPHARRARHRRAHARPTIAISILAELVAERTRAPRRSAAGAAGAATAIDPVCGMEVVASATRRVHLDVGGERFYFCCEGCRATFAGRPGGAMPERARRRRARPGRRRVAPARAAQAAAAVRRRDAARPHARHGAARARFDQLLVRDRRRGRRGPRRAST